MTRAERIRAAQGDPGRHVTLVKTPPAWTRANLDPGIFPEGFVPDAFTRGNVLAIVGHEPAGGRLDGPLRWHISVSARGRVPSWEELVRAAHDLRPGVCFTLGLPPKSWWLNLHPDVLHLWETDDPWLIEEYRINGRGDEPS